MARRTATRGRAVLTPNDRPLAGTVMPAPPRARLRERDQAIDAELSTVNGILVEAATGRTWRLIDLFKSTRTRDSRLAAVCRTRILAVQSRPWVIAPPQGMENDPTAIDVAARVRRIFQETVGLQKIIGHLAHGALEGFAVVEQDWRVNARGEIVPMPQWRHSNRFAWDTAAVELCKCEYGVDSFPGTPLSAWPGKFVVHAPVAGESDYPWFGGAMRARAVSSVVKRLGIRWWLKLLERWGQPQVYAVGDPQQRDGVGDEVMDALRQLGSAWFARFPQGTNVQAIPVTVDKDLHSTWVEFHLREDAIAILGQNLSTEVQAGSLAAAKVQANVRLDILAADLSELAETIVDQWIRWIVHYNWPGAPVPTFDFVLAPKEQITVAHYQAGLYTADQVRASMGWDPEPNGAGDRYYSGPAPGSQGAPTSPGSLTPISAPSSGGAAPAVQDASSVAATALNGAQIDSLKGLANDVQTGALPKEAALKFALISFPSVDPGALTEAFNALVPGSQAELAPPGGAGAAGPFGSTPQSQSHSTMAPSATRSPSQGHPLTRSLSRP